MDIKSVSKTRHTSSVPKMVYTLALLLYLGDDLIPEAMLDLLAFFPNLLSHLFCMILSHRFLLGNLGKVEKQCALSQGSSIFVRKGNPSGWVGGGNSVSSPVFLSAFRLAL